MQYFNAGWLALGAQAAIISLFFIVTFFKSMNTPKETRRLRICAALLYICAILILAAIIRYGHVLGF